MTSGILGRLGCVELVALEVAITPATAAARDGVMNALLRQAPAAIDDLVRDVLPLIERIALPKNQAMLYLEDVYHPSASGPSLAAQRAFTTWGQVWHLEVAWVIDIVLRSMHYWLRAPRALQNRVWVRATAGIRKLPSTVPHPPSMPQFKPTSMSLAYYKALTEGILGRYTTEVLAAYERDESGGKKRWARATVVKSAPEHYDWLIQYQVLGKSFADIAVPPGGKEASQKVTDAVKRTASLVKLELRPARRGRPKTTANHSRRDLTASTN